MLARVTSCALHGIDAFPVHVEVDISNGALPSYQVVGLAATSVREGAVRIRSALQHIGHGIPRKRVTVNLAPADRRKEGAAFDLPIALAILAGEGLMPADAFEGFAIMGELGLDGELRSVRGVLSAAILAAERGMRGLVVPACCAGEARLVPDLQVIGARHVSELVGLARGELEICESSAPAPAAMEELEGAAEPDMSEVRGQLAARAAMEVAVAGGHNLLLVGPPGIGKTMLARRMPSILPPLTHDEALECTRIYSSLHLSRGGLVRRRPFRAPHHSISAPALLGGGSPPRAGELSLAHHGVLFLDELPEFQRHVIESLRQPLEDRRVVIGRVSGRIELPSSVLLAASANPCPCGWLGSRQRQCLCSPSNIERYRSRLSGPVLDRMDLQIFVPSIDLRELRCAKEGEDSATIRARVLEARERQQQRLAPYGLRCNAEMGARQTRETCPLSPRAETALELIYEQRKGMSARAIDRVIKVARTIADLEGSEHIDELALYQAASFRSLDADLEEGLDDFSPSPSPAP